MSSATLESVPASGRALDAARSLASRARPGLSLFASLFITVQLCLVLWVAVPSLSLGWRPQVVLSNSMSPGIRAGDVVLVEQPTEQVLPVGSMVLFDGGGSRGSVIHRVVEAEDGAYRTKGDANPAVDGRSLRADEVRGVGRLLVPLAGTPAMWLQTGQVGAFLAWALVTVAALFLARRPRLAHSKASRL